MKQNKQKIYIAGPMRGYDNFNFDAFDECARYLADAGYVPISPTDMDRLYEGWGTYPPEDLEVDRALKERCMRRDIEAIFTCDAIFMLKGWEDSSGANVEHALAKFLGLKVFYYDDSR